MACRRIVSPKTGEEIRSTLWDKIYKEVGSEELADKLYQQTLSPEFLEWFGDWTNPEATNVSKVVEDTGEPKIVYHLTPAMFDTFDKTPFSFFAESLEHAKNIMELKDISSYHTMPVFLNVKKEVPLNNLSNMDVEGFIQDTEVGRNLVETSAPGLTGFDWGMQEGGLVHVTFNPNQIKSLYNVGKFNAVDNNIYHQLDPKKEAVYSNQLREETPKKQKNIVEKILHLQRRISFSEEHGSYVLDGSKRLKRVSDVVKEAKSLEGVEGYYAFDGNETDFADNRAWGNQIDAILEGVLLGKTLEEVQGDVVEVQLNNTEGSAASMTGEAIAKVYSRFKDFKAEFPDSILLSQIALYNESASVAGTLDIVAVHPDGTISIIDLKSSVNPTNYNPDTGKFEDYNKVGIDGVTYKNRYNKGFPGKASKYETHQAQQSLYKGLAISKGFEFASDDLSILPIHLTEVAGDQVLDVKREPRFPLEASRRFVEAVSKDSEYDLDVDVSASDAYEELVDKVMKLLENKRKQFLKQGKEGNATFIKRLEDSLKDAEKTKVLNTFISDAHGQFLGTKSFSGLVKQTRNIMRQIYNKDYDNPTEVINRLVELKDSADLYNPEHNSIIKDLRALYRREQIIQGKEYAEGSPLHKLDQLMKAIEEVQETFQDQMPELLSEVLSDQISEEGVEANIEFLRRLNDRRKGYLKEAEKASESKAKRLRKRAKRLRNQIEEADGIINEETGEVTVLSPDKAMLVRELRSGTYKDIGTIDRWMTPAISSSNTIVASFAKLVKEKLEEAREKARQFSFEADDAFEKFKKSIKRGTDNVAKFNEGLYETITINGKEKVAFVQPIDITTYEKRLENKRKDLIRNNIAKGTKKYIQEISKWKQENTEARPEEDIKIGDVVLVQGRDSIIAEMKEKLSDFEYKQWERRNIRTRDGITTYKGELVVPKLSLYSNGTFSSLVGSSINSYSNLRTALSNAKGPQFEYYSFLINSYFKSQELYPNRYNEFSKFVLPAISKTSNDRIRENGLKNYFSYSTKDAYKLLAEDDETVGSEAVGSNFKYIPMLYHNHMDPSDTSLDLIASVMRFREAAERYKVQSDLSPIADSTLTLVRNTNPSDTDSLGRKVVDSAAKAMGINSWVKYREKHDGNNVAALLESFIDMQIYGQLNKPHKIQVPVFGEVDLGKLADSLMGFASKTQIALKPLLSVANSLQANVMVGVEASAGEFFTKKEWSSALVEYEKLEAKGDFFNDKWSNGIKRSKIGQLIDAYDALQGEFRDKFGRNMSRSALKRAWSWDTAFMLQHKGEHHVQVTTMIALMKKVKVKQDGKEISLYDAYEVDNNGQLTLKSGVDLNTLIDRNVQNRLHAMNKRMHGIYNSFDKPALERYWYGRLITMYRKFVVPGFKKRYKKLGIDHELGGITEGTYRTFFRALFQETNELLNYLNPLTKEGSNLSDFERANIKRTVTELATIAALGFIVILLKGIMESADDEEKKLYSYPLYWAMRLKTELKFYGMNFDPTSGLAFFVPDIMDTFRLFRTPTVTTTVIEKVIRLLSQLGDPMEEYKRDTGPYEKGDLKLEARFWKLLGVNGYTTHPEEAIKILELQTN